MSNYDDCPSGVPIIVTDRLTLRAHRLSDFNDCAAMWADPAVTRYIGGKPSTRQQSWSRMLAYVGHWAFMGFGYWAVEHTATSTFIGELGFADFKREIEFGIGDAPELGWALVSRMHAKGYATEAVRAVITWGDDNLASATTFCIVHPENVASIRVAQKAGFTQTPHTIGNERSIIVFRRQRSCATKVTSSR